MKFPVLALLVGAAGFIGSITRWLIGRFFGQMSHHFPLGTLIINVSGSLLLGWFMAHATRHQMSDTTRAIIGTGFIGTYTTFSTYMYESDRLFSSGADTKGMAYLVGSVALGLIAVKVGIMLARYS